MPKEQVSLSSSVGAAEKRQKGATESANGSPTRYYKDPLSQVLCPIRYKIAFTTETGLPGELSSPDVTKAPEGLRPSEDCIWTNTEK